ncbi:MULTISPECIES: hypothetical protein [unclassified Granulicatella]|uniref:hypothetical protein n=1 Tax=unclassified Granulicatella TaxID=2630493 RepID=UPI00066A5445|nr:MULTISPECIES: hypothetical protein [unclassified Granulicatella]
MKNRNELIEYFMDSLEYEDKKNIVDELKEEYNARNSDYMRAEKRITGLLPFEDFDNYDTAMIDLMTIIVCNAFILGYEQCKKDILNHINGTKKR